MKCTIMVIQFKGYLRHTFSLGLMVEYNNIAQSIRKLIKKYNILMIAVFQFYSKDSL